MRVLFIGEQPETVNFSDPALPPGLTAEQIHAGLARAMSDMAARGWQAELCLVRPDESAAVTVREKLAAVAYDCVAIGGGIRLPASRLGLFEGLINVVHKGAPGAAIAFNTSPESTADAVARVVGG